MANEAEKALAKMEWPSCEHGHPCFLKTGTRKGTTFGRSFFICCKPPDSQCKFVQPTKSVYCTLALRVVNMRCFFSQCLLCHMPHARRGRGSQSHPGPQVSFPELKDLVYAGYSGGLTSVSVINCRLKYRCNKGTPWCGHQELGEESERNVHPTTLPPARGIVCELLVLCDA